MAFGSQAQLEQHWRDSDRHPLCVICDDGFEDQNRFNTVCASLSCPRRVAHLFNAQHIQLRHPELWCGACGIGFASSGQLLEHYLEAEPSVHPTCATCGEGFESKAVLDEVGYIETQQRGK